MIDEMPEGYNVGWEVVGDRCITTGAIPSSHPFGGYYLKFETLIWYWNGEKRTAIKDQIFHRSEREAKKIHGYIVNNLKSGKGKGK